MCLSTICNKWQLHNGKLRTSVCCELENVCLNFPEKQQAVMSYKCRGLTELMSPNQRKTTNDSRLFTSCYCWAVLFHIPGCRLLTPFCCSPSNKTWLILYYTKHPSKVLLVLLRLLLEFRTEKQQTMGYLAQAVTGLTCIREVPSSIFGRNTDYADRAFRDFISPSRKMHRQQVELDDYRFHQFPFQFISRNRSISRRYTF